MMSKNWGGPEGRQKFILDAVARLSEPPEIHPGDPDIDEDDDKVELDGQLLSLELVRETLLSKTGLLEELFKQGVPLDWLEFPRGRAGREQTELPPDQELVDDSLQRLADRSATLGETYATILLESALRSLGSEEERRKLAAAVLRTLGGVAQSIRSTMPRESRRKGEALFVIEITDDGRIVGHWDKDSNDAIDIEVLFVNEGQLVGNLSEPDAVSLAAIVYSELAERQGTLPSFHTFDSQPQRVTLAWTRAQTEALEYA